MIALTVLRGVAIALLTVLAGVAIFRAPHDVLWKPAVVATEWGHLLGPLAILLAFPGRRPDPLGWVSLGAGLLLLTPWMRAIPVANRLEPDLVAAFGLPPGPAFSLGIPGVGLVPHRVEPVRLAIPAADGTDLPAWLYRGRPGAPLVVAIHGGSWNSGDPSQLAEMYHRLATAGYSVAAITYRFVPQFRHPAQADDVAAAVRWLESHASELGFDGRRVILYGRSAGGHLAQLQATKVVDPAIKGVLALYPVTDFDWSWDHPTNPWVVNSFDTITDLLGVR
jgi:acetyl esterase/lipase